MLTNLLSIGDGVLVLSFLEDKEVGIYINKYIHHIFNQFNFFIPDKKQKLTAYLYESLIHIKQIQPSKEIQCNNMIEKVNRLKNMNIYFLYFIKEKIADLFIEQEYRIDPITGFISPICLVFKATRKMRGVKNIDKLTLEELIKVQEDNFIFQVEEIRKFRKYKNVHLYEKWDIFWNHVKKIKNNKILSLLNM